MNSPPTSETAGFSVPDPTMFERIVAWCKMMLATKKMVLALWGIFFGVSGTAIYGNVEEINPWKKAAVEVGLVEPEKKPVIEPEEKPETSVPSHRHKDSHSHPDMVTVQELEQKLDALKKSYEKTIKEYHP